MSWSAIDDEKDRALCAGRQSFKKAQFALAMHGAPTLSIPAAAAMTAREDGARGRTLR